MKRSFFRYALFMALPAFFMAPDDLHASPIFVENFSTATVTIADGPTQLQFLNHGDGGNPNVAAVLENISILPVGTSTVPEPGSLSLMAIGLLGAAVLVHRRFQE
jgi:hypothetical protein